MTLQDLRDPAVTRSRPYHFDLQLIRSDLRAEVERLFDRPTLVQEMTDLFDKKRLQGREILTMSADMAPLVGVTYGAEPLSRELTKRYVEGSLDTLRTSPYARFQITVGWPDLRIVPSTETVVYVEGDVNLSEIAERADEFSYLLWFEGRNYLIGRVFGNFLELKNALPSARKQGLGIIHNGAIAYAISTTRLLDEEGRQAAPLYRRDYTTSGGDRPPLPILSVDTLPGLHEGTILYRNAARRETTRFRHTVEVARPQDPNFVRAYYRRLTPSAAADEGHKFSRVAYHLMFRFRLRRSKDASVLLGLRYRVATAASGAWRYGKEEMRHLDREYIRWQLEEHSSPETEIDVDLGEYASGYDRRVELAFFDEMGRGIGHAGIEIPADAPERASSFEPADLLIDDFGRWVHASAEPIAIDHGEQLREFSQQLEHLKIYAENVLQGRTDEEILTQSDSSGAAIDPPRNVSATSGECQVTLSWDAVDGAAGYKVFRATTNGGPYGETADLTDTTYVDTNVAVGLRYYYVIRAYTAALIESANSAQVSAIPT